AANIARSSSSRPTLRVLHAAATRVQLDERGRGVEAFVGPGADDRGLEVAPTPSAAIWVVDAHDRVADLVESARVLQGRAVRDVLAVDVERAAPFAVVVTVEAEVQAGTEMKAGVADCFDGDRARAAVAHRAVQRSAEHAPVQRVEPQLGPH